MTLKVIIFMDILNNDYSYWKYFDTWTLEDAWKIIYHYNCELLSSEEDWVKHSTVRRFKRILQKKAIMFVYDIDWIHEVEDYEDGECAIPVTDEIGDFVLIAGGKTKVHINEFIKWAYSESIPLPSELYDIVKHNWSNGVLMPNSRMTDSDYLALQELPELKNRIIQLEEDAKLLRHSIYVATRVPWLYAITDLEVPSTLDQFLSIIKVRYPEIPDDFVNMIYEALPRKIKTSKQTNNSQEGA